MAPKIFTFLESKLLEISSNGKLLYEVISKGF